jgi:hypothetical protein
LLTSCVSVAAKAERFFSSAIGTTEVVPFPVIHVLSGDEEPLCHEETRHGRSLRPRLRRSRLKPRVYQVEDQPESAGVRDDAGVGVTF